MPCASIYESTAHQSFPHGVALRSMFADELSDATLDAAIGAMENAGSPFSLIQFRGLGGQMALVASDATAFAHRDKRYLLGLIGVWLDQSEAPEPHRAWVDDLWQQVRHEGGRRVRQFLGTRRAGTPW